MAFEEFTGELDQPTGGASFVPFTGELDAPGGRKPQEPAKSAGAAAAEEPAFGDPTGSGDAAAIMAAAQPARASVLEGRNIQELPFDAAEAARLSSRGYAEATPEPGAPRPAQSVRASGPREAPTKATERGEALVDAAPPVRALFKGVSGIAQGAGGALRAVGDVTGIDALRDAGTATAKGAQEFEQGMGTQGPVAGFGPKSPVPYLTNQAEGAASSLGQSAYYASLLGPRAVIPLMSVMTAGQEYDQARNAGLDPAEALAGALPKGAFEAIGEKFTGLDKVAGAMGTLLQKGASEQAKKGAAEVLIRSGIREIPGEVVTYLGQTGVDLLPGIGLNPNLTMSQFIDGLRDTVVQSAMMGGAMAGGGHAVGGQLNAAKPLQSAQDMLRERWGDGFVTKPQVDPIAEIGKAQTVDEAIAAAQSAVSSSSAVDNIANILAAQNPVPSPAQQAQATIAELEAGQEAANAPTPTPEAATVDAAAAAVPAFDRPAASGDTAAAAAVPAEPAAAPVDQRLIPVSKRATSTTVLAQADEVPTSESSGSAAINDVAELAKTAPTSTTVSTPENVQNPASRAQAKVTETAPAKAPEAGARVGVQPAATGTTAGNPAVQAAGVAPAARAREDSAALAPGQSEAAVAEPAQVDQRLVPLSKRAKLDANPADVAKADAMAGEPLNKEWTAFAPDSGTLAVPRADMPQVKAEHRGALVNFLEARGIAHQQEEVPASSLKPTQAEFSPGKVEQAKGYTDTDRSILVSSDGHVLDGHHQWMAKLEAGEPVKVIRLDAPIKQLLDSVKEFPSAEVARGATPAAAAQRNETAAARAPQGKQVSFYPGKYGKGMGQDAAKLEAQRLNRENAGKGVTYTAEEHGNPKLENPWAVVGRKAETGKSQAQTAPAAKPAAATEKQAAPAEAPQFSRAAPETASPAQQATDILDAAGVTGKDRIDALMAVKAGNLTPEELKAAYPAKAEEGAAADAAEPADEVPATTIRKTDDLFALPRSEATSLEQIVADNDPNIQVKKTASATGRTEYEFTMPDGKTASMAVREHNPYATEEAPTVYGFDMVDGEMTGLVTERPGENADEVEGMDDVWIDVSRLKSAGDGAKIYNIAATYAHNNGMIFIGDPAGLSDEALRRRTEQMISSALKFGTTEHLAPHPRQVEGDAKLGVPPLKWVYGDDEGNLRRMIDVSIKATDNVFPTAKALTYDLDAGTFRNAASGRPVPFGELAQRIGEPLARARAVVGSGAGKAQAGWRTVARAALYRAIREAASNDAGRPGRGGILDWASEHGAGFSVDGSTGRAFPAKDRIFYSEREQARPAAVRNPSTVDLVQAAVAELIGGRQLPNKLGRVVAATAADIKSTWEPLIGHNLKLGSEGDAGVAQGFYDPRTKTTFLIADHISQGKEQAVAAHELMHKHGQAVLGAEGWDKLHSVISSWEHADEDSTERAVYNYASGKVRAVGQHLSSQEMFPYAVEAAIGMGVKPSLIAKKGTVERWLGSVKYAMQQAWGKITGKPETFKTQDLVDLAFGIAQMENPESAAAMGRITDAPVKTETPAFKKWFGDSKVVDAGGKPLVVYHGTSTGFTEFDTQRIGQNGSSFREQGFFFTDDAGLASDYANESAMRQRRKANDRTWPKGLPPRGDADAAAAVMPTYLSLQNPMTLDMKGRAASAGKTADAIEKAKERGHDGLIIVNVDDGTAGEKAKFSGSDTIYVAFRPEQIKSAIGNNGDFDGANPDIRFSRAPEPGTKLSPWRDETGRLQFAPGAWLYNKIGAAAGPTLTRLGLKAASPELRRQLRQMKIDVEKAQETAVAIARETTKLSEEERAMVSDLVEQELKVGVIPPAHAVKLAAMINDAMGRQTDELVNLGMLTKDSADKWRGKYLPRYYESKLSAKVGDAWADAMKRLTGRQSVMKGIKGKNLKGRGLYETIPEDQLKDYEALGWEVRDPDYLPGQPAPDGNIQMWRDFTPEERQKMGEIRDAGFRFVMGYMQTQRDIALGRMFERMAADPEQSSRLEKEGWVQVPTTVVSGTGAKLYGKLAGRWVPQETLSQLSNIEESTSAAWQMYRKAMGIWKEGKTSLNPVSHVNNMVSNLTMAHLAGVSYHRGDKYLAAARDFIKKPAMMVEAKENGLFLGTMTDTELMQSLPEELRVLAQKQESKGEKVARTGFDIMTFFLRRPMGAAYQAEDTFFRYLIYKDARERGLEPQDAVDYAQKFIFTYDDLPKGARRIRDFGIPFFSYTYKAAPALLHTALTHPLRMAAPAAVLWGANAAAYALATGADDDSWQETLKKYLTDADFRAKVKEKEKLEREHLPPWNKGTTALLTPKMIRLGMDETTKLPLFIDVSRIIPGGDLFDVSPNAGGLPIPQPITPSHPIFTTLVAMLGNKDMFLGKEIVDSNDTRGEAAGKRGAWLWKQLTPAITAGNYHWERGMNALAQANGGEVKWIPDILGGDATGIGKDGNPVQPRYAAMQTFGIKVRPIDLETAEAIEGNMKRKMIRDIDGEIKKLQRLASKGAISDRTLEKERDKAIQKKENLRNGLTVDGDTKD